MTTTTERRLARTAANLGLLAPGETVARMPYSNGAGGIFYKYCIIQRNTESVTQPLETSGAASADKLRALAAR